MTVKKMLVVMLTQTNAVVGAATRSASGAPPVEDLVGSGLLMRKDDPQYTVTIPSDELKVTEVDYSEDVLRNPLAHVIDAGKKPPAVMAAGLHVTAVSHATGQVSVTVDTPIQGKNIIIVVDTGPGREPKKLTANSGAAGVTNVPVSGVPQGDHLTLASVEGYASFLDLCTFP